MITIMATPPATSHRDTIMYTVQLFSRSGSFGLPAPEEVHHVRSKKEAGEVLLDWAEQHSRVGSVETDAYALLWKGQLRNVQDQYPDLMLDLGPRLGVRQQQC